MFHYLYAFIKYIKHRYIKHYFQLLTFLTMQFNINLFLKIMSFVLPVLFVTIKYCFFIVLGTNVSTKDKLFILKYIIITFIE